jgi:hypothetical protein
MEKKQEIFPFEIKNPVYQALENQLHLEFEWAYADKNLYSASWIALNLKDLENENLEKIEILVKENLEKFDKEKMNEFLTTEFVLGLCFATAVLHDKERKVPAELFSSLSLLLDEAKKRNWLNSYEFASLILKSLSDINKFDGIVQEAYKWVMEKYQEFIKNKNYEGAIDCLYGLRFRKHDVELSMGVLHEVTKQINEMSDETLAKLCIILKDENKEFAFKLIRELERRLEEEFKSSFSFSLERGLREVTSLLNSGYPPEAIKLIIKVKRREGQSWAKYVSTKGEWIIIKKIPELGGLSKIDPKVHALAFKALELHNRSQVIELSKEEFKKLEDAYRVTKKDYFGIRKIEYWVILLITSISSFFAIIFLPEILTRISTFDYQYAIILVQEIMQDWTKVIRYGNLVKGFLIWAWLWLIRALYALRRGGEISISKLICLMPIIGDGIRKFLHTEE